MLSSSECQPYYYYQKTDNSVKNRFTKRTFHISEWASPSSNSTKVILGSITMISFACKQKALITNCLFIKYTLIAEFYDRLDTREDERDLNRLVKVDNSVPYS